MERRRIPKKTWGAVLIAVGTLVFFTSGVLLTLLAYNERSFGVNLLAIVSFAVWWFFIHLGRSLRKG
jgi:hypothetical protein